MQASKTSRRIVAAFIAVQIAVPAAALAYRWVDEGSRPIREYPLSWQMYSSAGIGGYVGVTDTNQEVELSIADLPPVIRGVGYGPTVQELFCDTRTDLQLVRRAPINPDLDWEDVKC